MTPTADVVDFGQTATATSNRQLKARTLEHWAWDAGLTADDVEHLDPATRRRLARDAGVNPPRDTSPTWTVAVARLAAREAWARRAVGDPAAARQALHLRAGYILDAAPELPAAHEPGVVPTVPERRLSSVPADVPPPSAWPRGWAQLAALGPIAPPTPCGVTTRTQRACGAPAIVWAQGYAAGGADRHVARCANHPPMRGEWGWRLAWTPGPCLLPLRCYCGRCPPHPLATPPGDTVIDDQAIASGKHRSTPERYAEARARHEGTQP